MPRGWLHEFAWKIDVSRVTALAAASAPDVTFLCGTAENELEVWHLFDAAVCLVIDDETLRHRPAARTTNEFGKHPEELAAAREWNGRQAGRHRELGATIVDATRPLVEVVQEVLAAVPEG